MEIRDFISNQGGKYKLYPYAKDLWYRPDIEVLGMTIEIYSQDHTYEFRFAFEVNDKLEQFLSMLEEV